MTENQTVGGEGNVGASGTPNPQVSQTPQTPIQGDVTQLLTQLESRLEEKFGNITKEVRGLQSRQDKSENTFQAQLARMEQLTSKGLTKEEALSTMQKEDNEYQWRSSLEKKLDDILAGRIASAGTQANGQQKVAEVFAQIGLDPKDPRVAQHLVKNYETPEQMELAARRLEWELRQTPSPNSAQAASLQGNSAQVDVNALAAEYDQLAKNPTAKGATTRMAEIQEELNKIK